MSSEGAIGISDGDRNDLKFNRLEIPNSYSLQQSQCSRYPTETGQFQISTLPEKR
jgi:hypothetical protein